MCKYKDLFGKPGTGIHKIRLFNISLIDFFFTLFAAFLFSKFITISKNPRINVLIHSLFLFLLGILVHRLFCVRTTFDKFLFPFK